MHFLIMNLIFIAFYYGLHYCYDRDFRIFSTCYIALERVPPGHPKRIPLELFSEESLRRIDGLDVEEGNLISSKNDSLKLKNVVQ